MIEGTDEHTRNVNATKTGPVQIVGRLMDLAQARQVTGPADLGGYFSSSK